MNFNRILFAVDGGPHARVAAGSVARLACATRADVTVLHVTHGPPPTAVPVAIERIAQQLRAAGVPTHIELRGSASDDVAETIVSTSRELDSSLLALGSRGLSDLSGLFRGSVSHRVIALSDIPVLVVRYRVCKPDGAILRILLAIEGGDEVPHALEAAMTIAKATDAEVLVLHAMYLVAGIDSLPYIDPDDAERTVVTVVQKLTRGQIHAVASAPVADSGVPWTIAHEARTWNADLVVIGSRRLSDLASLLLGGIDHELSHRSDRTVLVAERSEPVLASAKSG